MSSRGGRWTRNRWNNGGQYQERGGRNFSQRGFQGPRGRGRDDDYSESSPQNSGCFGFFNKNRQRYIVTDDQQGKKSTMSNVIARLGLPVRGRGLKTQSRGRMAQQSRRDVGPSWYKILIPYGRQFGKDFILNSLRSYVDGDIYPVFFKFLDTGEASFFLENSDEAESVRAANKRIRTQNGKSMEVKKFAVPCPFIPCHSEEASLIKDVLGSRYDAANRHLNLSSFSLDPVLKEHDTYCSLQKNNVVMLVSKLIGENCPDVRSIDLSGNRVRYLDYLSAWVPRAKHVQRVSFAQNQIQNMQELEKMKGWNLVEIELDHNPLCLLFKEKTTFISAVHKIFPKVTLLDGVAVDPEIRFELEDEVAKIDKRTIPNFLPGFYVNEDIRKLVETFVVEFYKHYDGADPTTSRQGLIPAYEPDATFTMVAEKIDADARYSDNEIYLEYRRDSHNIKQLERWERYRTKLTQKGAINVVAKLTRMPKTQHVMDSFLVDVSFAADNVMAFTVQGLFRDGELANTDSNEMKFFSRSFLVIPKEGNKISVVNDMLFITPYSLEQIEQYSKMLQKAVAGPPPSLAPPPTGGQAVQQPDPSSLVPGPSQQILPPGGASVAESRAALVARFAAESKMNEIWARKCLEDNNWSYETAGQVFLQMKQQDVIPAEAFQ